MFAMAKAVISPPVVCAQLLDGGSACLPSIRDQALQEGDTLDQLGNALQAQQKEAHRNEHLAASE